MNERTKRKKIVKIPTSDYYPHNLPAAGNDLMFSSSASWPSE